MRPWTIEGLAAARALAAANCPLSRIGIALDRTSGEIDHALWALVGRTPDQALKRLNGWRLGEDPQDLTVLREQILDELAMGSAEVSDLARRLRVSEPAVAEVLQILAEQGLVDALDPPPHCDRRHLRWFVLPGAAA